MGLNKGFLKHTNKHTLTLSHSNGMKGWTVSSDKSVSFFSLKGRPYYRKYVFSIFYNNLSFYRIDTCADFSFSFSDTTICRGTSGSSCTTSWRPSTSRRTWSLLNRGQKANGLTPISLDCHKEKLDVRWDQDPIL